MSPTPRANPAAFERRSGQAGKVTSTQADLLAAAAYIDPPGGDNEVGVLDSQEARRLAAMLRHVAASPAISPDEDSVQGWLAALSDALLASKGNDWLHEKLKEIITHLASQVRHTEAAESALLLPGGRERE